ncbi:MAG: methyltransferase domain-containing protein [Deltaproteobacteria bacterium]|nr:methyltransferase domain-containing protein [Deltaproteobacteria bacterium]
MAQSTSPSKYRPDHHDWDSSDYVAHWAAGQDPKEALRQKPFAVLADTIPHQQNAAIKILDIGAGYGALTQFLLQRFPNAEAVCQDGSSEMAQLGSERMKHLAGRFNYAICDFSRPKWVKDIPGNYAAAVSSIAIHNVRDPKIMQRVYGELFPLVKPGGCFLNFDRPRPPWEDQLKWLSEAGFHDTQIFWRGENRAVYGGFRST